MLPRVPSSKIGSLAQVAGRTARARRRGHRIVFTNGCFDLLHRGHVAYLNRARRLGDLLVVALNSDASVRELKGPGRPLNPLADRMEVLAGLECVDLVTWFNEATPLKAILKIRPEVLVKGGDWATENIVGAPETRSWGGSVKSLSFLEGRSTTALIRKAGRRSR